MVFLSFACSSLALAAGPRIAPEEAPNHRGQEVVLVGPVTEVQRRADGMILMVGTRARVPVIVPQSALDKFDRDLTTLHQRTIEVTGDLTTQDKPLGLVLESPDQLAIGTPKAADVQSLQEKVRALEVQNAKLRAQTQQPPLKLVTYGPNNNLKPVPPHALEFTVLADRGVPDRVEWRANKRVLVYGRTRYFFDDNGQLVDTRQDP